MIGLAQMLDGEPSLDRTELEAIEPHFLTTSRRKPPPTERSSTMSQRRLRLLILQMCIGTVLGSAFMIWGLSHTGPAPDWLIYSVAGGLVVLYWIVYRLSRRW